MRGQIKGYVPVRALSQEKGSRSIATALSLNGFGGAEQATDRGYLRTERRALCSAHRAASGRRRDGVGRCGNSKLVNPTPIRVPTGDGRSP